MNFNFQNVNILLRFPFFTALGVAIFMGGCSYSYTQTQRFGSKMSTSNIQFRENIEFKWHAPTTTQKYTGPQNAQELMNALDTNYNAGHSKTEVSISHTVDGTKITYSSKLTENEIDARYPRAEWLQTLLDKGIAIENFGDYSRYLLKRHTLVLLEDNPDLRQLGIYDIPPMDDWKSHKSAYINKLVKDHAKHAKK